LARQKERATGAAAGRVEERLVYVVGVAGGKEKVVLDDIENME
jgi:hypothetical protein